MCVVVEAFCSTKLLGLWVIDVTLELMIAWDIMISCLRIPYFFLDFMFTVYKHQTFEDFGWFDGFRILRPACASMIGCLCI